jgi:16S rRNA (cytosine1407-C5)-methyltransferase
VEPVKARYFRLRSNLQRHGATMVRTYRVDGRAVGAKTPERFDRVLLDAPCSSEGRFTRSEPESWRYWSLRKIGEMVRKQRGLLESAFRALKPEGVLVYCTCAFAPEENEMAIDALLHKHPEELEVEALELPIANVQRGMVEWQGRVLEGVLERCVRVLPNGRMGGFFLCRLRKRPTKGGKSRTNGL